MKKITFGIVLGAPLLLAACVEEPHGRCTDKFRTQDYVYEWLYDYQVAVRSKSVKLRADRDEMREIKREMDELQLSEQFSPLCYYLDEKREKFGF
ncbi:MAG: hypothetical protein JXQ89_18550 [Pelagimonas sp.]|jgi:hypothetical protein